MPAPSTLALRSGSREWARTGGARRSTEWQGPDRVVLPRQVLPAAWAGPFPVYPARSPGQRRTVRSGRQSAGERDRGMRFLQTPLFTVRAELFPAELPHGFKHGVARLPGRIRNRLHQAMFDQRSQRIGDSDGALESCLSAKPLRGRQREATAKYREHPEELPRLRVQQLIPPGDGVAHRPLSGRSIARTASQQWETLVESLQERRRRQHGGTRRYAMPPVRSQAATHRGGRQFGQ